MNKLITLVIFLTGLLLVFNRVVVAQSPQDRLEELKQQIEEAERKLAETRQRKITLKNEIDYQNNQIRLTELKIAQTQEEINSLSVQIESLEKALSGLSVVFAKRALATYKAIRSRDSLPFLLLADDVSSFITRLYYLRRIQSNDKVILVQMQTTQSNYELQREKRKQLQEKLEDQKEILAEQKAQKQHLLEITKNDEEKFQQLLAQARAEYNAIQAVIAGLGKEVEVRKVSKGEKIASIIPGPSCNSGGGHLHFIVRKAGDVQNPFNYLKSGIDFVNCSGPGSCSPGDPFNPQGSWDWPISPKIRFTQGYGKTWAVQNTWVGRVYSFHNGIDITSESSLDVHAVASGTLYRGSFVGSDGCALRYVRVDHDGSDIDTLYLHVNY